MTHGGGTSRTLCLLIGGRGQMPEEVAVTCSAEHRVSDLTQALADHLAGPAGPHTVVAAATRAAIDPDALIADTELRHGDHLLLLEPGEDPPPTAQATLELRVLSGAVAGLRLPLADGRRSLGRAPDCDLQIADPSVSRAPAWLQVKGRDVVLESVEERQAIRIDDRPLTPPVPLAPGQVFEIGSARMVVAEVPPNRPPGRRGSLTLRRGPRTQPTWRTPEVELPLPPRRPAPLPGLGPWLRRRQVERYREQARAALAPLPALLAEELRARHAATPDAADLADRARLCLPALWERRPGDADFLRLGLGRGVAPSEIRVGRPPRGADDLVGDVLRDLLPEPPSLRGAPLHVDLGAHRVLAVTGDAAETAGLVRWLVLQAACLHAPSDLRIAAALAGGEGWGWLKWLPHAAPHGIESAHRLIATGGDVDRLIDALSATVVEGRAGPAGPDPSVLAIVDDACPGADRLVRQVLDAPDAGVFVLLVGPRPQPAVPASVRVTTARNQLRLSIRGAGPRTGVPDQVGAPLASRVARDLSGIVEQTPDGRAREPGLLDVAGTQPSPGDELRERWAADAGRLDAVLGAGRGGPVEVDVLTGPHAAITGGAHPDRSELLGAWVAALALRHSPRWLNVVLLDAAGGAGWDELRRLPHAVALPATVEREIDEIVGALQAEAARRRQVLAAAGEPDMVRLARRRPGSVPATLLVAVAGYDLLVSKRPDMDDRLGRLAEQGPDVGIHLIAGLATGAEALPRSLRRGAGLRIELGVESRSDLTMIGEPPAETEPATRLARVTLAQGISTELTVPDANHLGAGEDGSIRVRRLLLGPSAAGGSDVARLVETARDAAADLRPPVEELVWRIARAAPAAAIPADALDAAAKAGRARVALRLTVESPPLPAHDVEVDLGLDRTFAELGSALTAQLGLGASSTPGVYQRRRHAWLRPDQSVRTARLRIGDRLVVAPRSFRVEEAADPAPEAAETDDRVDDAGRIAVNRPPRPSPSAPALQVALAGPPTRGQGGWRALMPVGTGVLMGLMLGGTTYLASGPGRSPGIVLVSAAMTPLMALLTGILPAVEAVRRRRTFRTASRAWREELEGLEPRVAAAQALEASALHDAAPDVDTLVQRARTLAPTLWERRPDSPDWLGVRLGLEDVPSGVSVAFADGGEPNLRTLADQRIGSTRVTQTVPMTLSLAGVGAVGLHGDRSGTGALARSLLAQLALLHSPEELVLAAAVPAAQRQSWAWLGWLPHAHSRPAVLPGPRVVSGPAAAGDLLQRLMALVERRARLAGSARAAALGGTPAAVVALLHEDVDLPRGDVSRLLELGPPAGVHVVWLAARREDLPGEAAAEVGVKVEGAAARPELRQAADAGPRTGTALEGMSVEACFEAARALAPLTDLGARLDRGAIPDQVDLLDLLGLRERLDAGIRRRWVSSRPSDAPRLAAPIGAGEGGTEVAVDLHHDGPHLLVEGAGRTGKSELLRALVASLVATFPPTRVSMLLVDHEVQGTFRECAGLPHAASVIGQVDAGAAARVLTAIRAEQRRRETLLGEAGVTDLGTLEETRPEIAPPRLVVVVDELSRLAVEQPDLMAGLAALAPHGARLGVHLVLSTRQSSSVVRGLRDGIELRIVLGADVESGGPTRADLPPGRASLRAGGVDTPVQVAAVSGRSPMDRDPALIVVQELEFGGRPAPETSRRAAAADDSDLARVVRAAVAEAPRRDAAVSPVLVELSEAAAGEPAAPTSVPLAELLGIPDVAALDVDTLWRLRPPAERLRVPTGLTGLGRPMLMDLKEAAVGGAGPHGLIIGTSGSGKSEMLRTLVTSLAITHPPELLAFVFIDFKGGAAFAGLSELPHVAGMITNLQDDLSLIDRMQAAITGERNRRQELLRRAGNVDKLSEYQRKRESGEPLDPLPYLLLVVDEFGELLTARPDFINLFAMVGRVGRSLGIHLLFSSQQFEEGRLRGLEDNIGYRIALRTASPLASRTVLGVTDAFELPKEPGWGYFKFGPTDMVRFRAALVSQPYAGPSTDGSGAADAPTTLDVVVDQLRDRAAPVHQIWLPPLEVGITLDRLLPEIAETRDRGLAATGWPDTGRLHVPVGLVDRPAEQRQDVMTVDLTGHLLVVGSAQTGKSTTVRTLVAGAALTHTPREAQFYCLDYGGGTLRTLADLPHVGGVAGRGEVERVRRTVEEVAALVAAREVRFRVLGIDSPQVMRARRDDGAVDDLPDVFLVVDNWAGLRQELPDVEDVVRDVIAARGAGYGVHLLLTANRWTEVRDALRSAIGGRLELRLTEPTESAVDVRAAKSLADSAGQYEKRAEELRQLTGSGPRFEKLFGRGIVRGGLQFQVALPRVDGAADILALQRGVEDLVRAVAVAWSGPAAPPIRVLPASIRLDRLPRPAEPQPGVPIGISEHDLGPVSLDLVDGDPHFLVFGDVESGKTTLLRTFLTGLVARTNPDQAQILIVDYRRGLAGLVPPEQLLAHCGTEAAARENIAAVAGSLERRLPPPDAPPDQLHGRSRWKSAAEVYVVVDDYDLVATSSGGPLQPLYGLLPQSRDVALHLVIARSSGGAGQGVLEPVLRRLRELRTPGLLMSGEPPDQAPAAGRRMAPLPPGRGRLIRRREGATFVQVALPDDD